ncbi:SDR family NAD(P)-dependent oxidoreductase [Pseudoalteromonas sp. SSDWG2]|uniref:SDR family NAD(P)-dependent oxidoreductase n=1 Tax=Pseudoalteromonas sp. SSDWG2 TaxID=3139391 RepID=UPI003BAD76E7
MARALVVGASSAIAQALVAHLEEQGVEVHSVSRTHAKRQLHTQMHYSAQSVEQWSNTIAQQGISFDSIFICNGMLHGDTISPEKSLSAFDATQFEKVLHCNTVVPMWWLMNITKLVHKARPSVVTVMSARVGSISDNRLGGWYSYRASKAALNMLTKTASIEVRRTHKQCSFLLFHPGTTDTPLSKPFQKNVPASKLFTPEFVAQRMYSLSTDIDVGMACEFRDWDSQPIDF